MIDFCNVTKHYSQTTALKNITLEFCDNSIYCLLGRNGAGKTTLLKLIAGHINASSGIIKVGNKPVSTMQMPNCVSFIESGASQFNMRIIDLINCANNLQDNFDVEFAHRTLKKFGLGKNNKYKQLSFGMRTMVTTLLSLSSNSEIVILDEPVLGLDAIMRKRFYDMLTDSFENRPRIIIISTHLIDEIAGIAEKLIIIDKGEILLKTTANEVFEKAYSLTGITNEVMDLASGLNIIGERSMSGFTAVTVFDKRIDAPKNITVQPVGLQDFFINVVEGNDNEK
ncbi:MAG: ABC transporter ATP-binding protein [Clostridiaceae bacterium]